MAEQDQERYELREELGRGGSASVVHAYDRVLERSVALKVLSGPIANDPEFMSRFEREARLAARLDHPNIVTIYDFGRFADGRGFIAMRLLTGRGLEQVIAPDWPPPAEAVARIVAQVAQALDYTHSVGMVHRDVKPNNVIIDPRGRATLTDFGIARAFDSARVTMTGLSIGTPRYMAPEQIRGEDVTSAADIYALGVMTFEILAGRGPFEGEGTSLMYKIVHEAPPPLSSVTPSVAPSVSDVVAKALAKDPSDRWQTAGEFGDALTAALMGTGRHPVMPASTDQQTIISSNPWTGPNAVPVPTNPPMVPPVTPPPGPALTGKPAAIPNEPTAVAPALTPPPGPSLRATTGPTVVPAAPTGVAPVSTLAAPVLPPTPEHSAVAASPPAAAPKKSSGGGRMLAIVAAVALVAAGGAGLAMALGAFGGGGDDDGDGRTSDPDATATSSGGVVVPGGTAMISVAAGESHTCGLTTETNIACWGSTASDRLTAPDGNFNDLAAGRHHSCAIRDDEDGHLLGLQRQRADRRTPGRFTASELADFIRALFAMMPPSPAGVPTQRARRAHPPGSSPRSPWVGAFCGLFGEGEIACGARTARARPLRPKGTSTPSAPATSTLVPSATPVSRIWARMPAINPPLPPARSSR